jgi:hypothetical protein
VSNEPLKREFVLETQGRHPDIDAMLIVAQLLRELEPEHVRAVVGYINCIFGDEP